MDSLISIDGKQRQQELAALLASHEGERHAILLQDFPDPDAIACGLAYRLIAAEHGIEADMLYAGRLSHQENIALVNLLGIELIRTNGDKITPERYQGAVFVDNQGTTSTLTERLATQGIPVLVVVDHHEFQDCVHPQFMDLRPLGACSTIFAEYLQLGMLPFKTSKPEHRRVATALMHGIISETGSLIRGEPTDFTLAAFLKPFTDSDLLEEIINQKRSHKVMDVIRLALANRVTREGLCLSGVGSLREDDRDAIPQAADFLLTEENVHTVVVYGIVASAEGGETIHGSLRTNKHAMSPDTFLKEALGQSRDGSYYGGGKAMAGGFEIPLGFLSGNDDPELARIKWDAYNVKIRRKFFSKIGVEEH